MDIEALIQTLEVELAHSLNGAVRLDDARIATLTPSETIRIQNHFAGKAFLYLPKTEITFFEWLKKEDVNVWNDLWVADEEPYIVSFIFLNHFTADGNGFPICDLVENDNYYFTEKHLRKPEGIDALQGIMEKLTNHKTLSVAEALLYECYCNPIDIWRFAYKHAIPLHLAKKAAQDLALAGLLAHLTKREDLVSYIDF